MKFKENVLLKDYTSLQVGGPAKYFCLVDKKEDLILAALVAKKFNLPFFVLGRGTNVLFPDKGYEGLVILVQASKIKSGKDIYAEAGAKLSDLVKICSDKSLQGLEWAVGIPGSIGGAVRGNAGAFGSSIGDSIREVEIFDMTKMRIKKYGLKDCFFSYRNSIFKKNPNLIILSALFNFNKGSSLEIKRKIRDNMAYRRDRHPLNFPSAGSVFENLKDVSAGELIDKCGFKGKKIGGAEVSKKHANFIINTGKAKSEDIVKLIELIKKKVKDKFKISLKEEVEIL